MNEMKNLTSDSIFRSAYYEKSESYLYNPEIQSFLREEIKKEKGLRLIKLYLLLETAPLNEKERLTFEHFLIKKIKQYPIIEELLQTEAPKDDSKLFNFYQERLEQSKRSKVPNLYFHIAQTAIHRLLSINETASALTLLQALESWTSAYSAPNSMQAYVYYLYALYYTYIGDSFDHVKIFSEKAIDLSLKGNAYAKSNIPLFQMHLANSLMKNGDIHTAIELFQEVNKNTALPLPLKVSNLCYTGEAFFRKSEPESALPVFNTAYLLSKKIDRKDLAVSSLLMIGACNNKMNNPSAAFETYNKALKLAKAEKLILHQLKIYEGLILLNLRYTLNINNAQDYFSEYKRTQDQLMSEKKQQELLELEKKYELNKLKELYDFQNRFYNFISHEFKTPLSIILAQSELLSQELKNDPIAYKKLESIHSNSLQISSLINSLLDISRLENNQYPVNEKYINITHEVKSVVEKHIVLSKNKSQEYTLIIPRESVYGYFDINIVEKIVDNLLSNAIKFTNQNGKIICKIVFKQDKLIISVEDNGVGLKEDEKDRIFDRFQSFHQDTSINATGAGLGLSLVKELCSLLKGDITVKSEVNKGSTFTVVLPLKGVNIKNAVAETDKNKVEVFKPNFTADILTTTERNKRATILIVEDNIELNEFLCNYFKEEYKVLSALNGQDGENLALDELPDVIISDVMMPHKSGIELCKSIKNNLTSNHIPFILLTAKNDSTTELVALRNLADDFIKKPFSISLLNEKIHSILENRAILQKYFSDYLLHQTPKDSSHTISKTDMNFIDSFKSILDESIFDKDLSVQFIAEKMNISRMTLLRKVLFYTNKRVKQLIHEAKMRKAFDLLTIEKYSVKKTAELLGYRKLQIFHSHFKSFFGITPGKV